ncbi:MAG: DUF1638 domain-containing protein [Clostridiales bacterium]
MTKVIVGCEMIKPEIEAAVAKTGREYEIIYIDAGLHTRPKLLREELEKVLCQLKKDQPAVDTVLLAMALCGNAVIEFTAPMRLVVPKMDDCLTMFLHTNDEAHLNLKKTGEYYTTKGWLTVKNYIKEEHDFTIEKYGEKKGKKLLERIYLDYHALTMIENGTFDPEEIKELAEETASYIGCPLKRVAGSNLVLEKLIDGRWDEQFLIAEAGEMLTLEDFMSSYLDEAKTEE